MHQTLLATAPIAAGVLCAPAHAAGRSGFVGLGTLGVSASKALALNDSGLVVGHALTLFNLGQHAYGFSAGSMQDLGTPGGSGSFANAINVGGQVVGQSHIAGWTLTAANGINRYTQIAGTATRNGNSQAYLLTLQPDRQGGNGPWDAAATSCRTLRSASTVAWSSRARSIHIGFGNCSLADDIDNRAGAQVIVAQGAEATLRGGLHDNGELRVNGAANFFGLVSGAGGFTGNGTADFEGGFAPGNSPAVVTVDFLPVFGAGSTILLELAGTAPGNAANNHHRLIFGNSVQLQGGTLDVVCCGGFEGQAGDHYDLFNWNGGLVGNVGSVNLPTLSAGLSWQTQTLYVNGEISITAVPEPEPWALRLAGLAVMASKPRRPGLPVNPKA